MQSVFYDMFKEGWLAWKSQNISLLRGNIPVFGVRILRAVYRNQST